MMKRTTRKSLNALRGNRIVFTELTERAQRTLAMIKRKGESEDKALNRILETLVGIAPDFDHFFGLRQENEP